MKRDGFLRCYLEAMVLWIGGHVIVALAETVAVALGLESNPLGETLASRIAPIFDPVFLVASGILIIPLFAAILIGARRATGAARD